MKITNLYKVHEFMKMHSFQAIGNTGIQRCTECKMLFTSDWFWSDNTNHYRSILEKEISETSSIEKITNYIPEEILEYNKDLKSVQTLFWSAVKTKDPGSHYLKELASIAKPHELQFIMPRYVQFVGRSADTDMVMFNIPHLEYTRAADYCRAANEPIPFLRTLCKDRYAKQFWYRNVDEPMYTIKIKESDELRDKLWKKMSTYWKNTAAYNSLEYKNLEKEHANARTKVDIYKKIRKNLKSTLK